MSKENEYSRRENGLTVRFLAQCLVNDLVFPDQAGIKALLSKARVECRDGTTRCLPFDLKGRFDYHFLFHMDDCESGDKSEIDLLLRQGDTLYAVEVKAFTNPNETDVKREIIRNHITLERIAQEGKFFDPISRVFSILLYSKNEHLKDNPSAKDYEYFNDVYLFSMGLRQKHEMKTWNSKSIKIGGSRAGNQKKSVQDVGSHLYFLTWVDVLTTLGELNDSGRFDHVMSELRKKSDRFKKGVRNEFENGTMLV